MNEIEFTPGLDPSAYINLGNVGIANWQAVNELIANSIDSWIGTGPQKELKINIDLDNNEDLNELIGNLKIIYEDFWKENNLINTSIKLPLLIQVDNNDLNLSSKFEKTLDKIDLISNYSINKFNKDFIFYEVIFNGTSTNFINVMKNENYNFDTQKKIWILK